MLLLNPRLVKFGAIAWDNILAIAIDRSPRRTVEEWSDLGPYAVLADVPEQKVRIRIVQEIAAGDIGAPRPGEQASLSFFTSPTASDAGRRRISATAVILDIQHELSLRKGALRTITLAAISGGADDPITIADAGAEA